MGRRHVLIDCRGGRSALYDYPIRRQLNLTSQTPTHILQDKIEHLPIFP